MAQITKDTGIIEAVQKYPQIIEIFQQYGLGCIGCMAAHFETIGQGAGAHGIDVDALIAISFLFFEHRCLSTFDTIKLLKSPIIIPTITSLKK